MSAKRKAEASCESDTTNKKRRLATFNLKRMRVLTKQEEISSKHQGIVYWMWRDQRVQGIRGFAENKNTITSTILYTMPPYEAPYCIVFFCTIC
jgi:hypothetical protein